MVAAVTQPGGFSPGAAARLRIVNGRRAFAKAVAPDLPTVRAFPAAQGQVCADWLKTRTGWP